MGDPCKTVQLGWHLSIKFNLDSESECLILSLKEILYFWLLYLPLSSRHDCLNSTKVCSEMEAGRVKVWPPNEVLLGSCCHRHTPAHRSPFESHQPGCPPSDSAVVSLVKLTRTVTTNIISAVKACKNVGMERSFSRSAISTVLCFTDLL